MKKNTFGQLIFIAPTDQLCYSIANNFSLPILMQGQTTNGTEARKPVPVVTIVLIVIVTIALVVVAGITAISIDTSNSDDQQEEQTTQQDEFIAPVDEDFVTTLSEVCSFEVSYDKTIYTYKKTNTTEKFFGDDTLGALVTGKDGNARGQILIECSKKEPLVGETTIDLTEALRERFTNNGYIVNTQIIDENVSFGEKTVSVVKYRLSKDSKITEEILHMYVDQEANVSYIIKLTNPAKDSYQEDFQNVFNSITLGKTNS